MRPGFVTGLIFEADILRKETGRRPLLICCAGGSLERAELGALSLIEQGADIIISFGLAGALKPDLVPGELIIPERILQQNLPTLTCDSRFQDKESQSGPLLSSATAITTPVDKTLLHRETGAIAVDMESYGAARIALQRQVPFVAIRVIADPADRVIPKAAIAGMAADGSLRIGAVLLELLKRPQDLPALIRLGHDTKRAKEALRRAARLHFG